MVRFSNCACCGLTEIDGLSHSYRPNPEKQMRELLSGGGKYYNRPIEACAVFTQANYGTGVPKDGYGFKFADYIRRQKLGTVVKARPGINHNHDSRITAFIWTFNKTNLQKWARKHKLKMEAW